MRKQFVVLAISALTACVTARGVTIVNSGFETGSFSGWSLSGNVNLNTFETVCATGTPINGTVCTSAGGTFAAALGPFGSPVHLTQSISTQPGSLYDVSFFVRNENLGQQPANAFTLSFANNAIFTRSNWATFNYTEITIPNVLATSSSTLLDFSVFNNPGGFFLDNVAVDAVPEPTTAILLLAPLAAGFLLRRRFTKERE